MNGKKSKLLRKLAKAAVTDASQPFKVLHTRKFDKNYIQPDGKQVSVRCSSVVMDRGCAAFIYNHMKSSYHEMLPLYAGMRAHKL